MTYIPKKIVILGPTASGKTRLAVALAQKIGAEIISADSRQVYKGMDIGTGKDLAEYQNIPFHLIDMLDAGQKYNVFAFQQDYQKAEEAIFNRCKNIIICGGTGLYIQSVIDSYQFTAIPINEALRHNLEAQTDEQLLEIFQKQPSTPFHAIAKIESRKRLIRAIEINEYLQAHPVAFEKRPASNFHIIGLALKPECRRKKISERLKTRIDQGLIAEIQQLAETGVAHETLKYYGLEYKFGIEYLEGKYDFDTFFKLLETAIHQFAKRQMTYFRKMEKDGHKIHWLDAQQDLAHQLAAIESLI